MFKFMIKFNSYVTTVPGGSITKLQFQFLLGLHQNRNY